MPDSRVAARSFYVGRGADIVWYYPGDRVPEEIAKTLPDIMWEAVGDDPVEVERRAAARASAQQEKEKEVAKAVTAHDHDGEVEEEEVFEIDHDLEGLTVAQLRQLAEDQGVDIKGITKKRDLQKAIGDAL